MQKNIANDVSLYALLQTQSDYGIIHWSYPHDAVTAAPCFFTATMPGGRGVQDCKGLGGPWPFSHPGSSGFCEYVFV